MSQPYIVFGYGSLIFKPPPHTISQVNGFLKGYVRRFAQSSNDHRGTPESLGRVVTLVSAEDWAEFSAADPFPHEDIVWGVAYTIDPAYAAEVRDYLDYREKNGYTVHHTDVYGFENGVETIVAPQAVVYVGRKDNPAFVGSEDLDVLAARIYTSVGPSGKNKDYLYDLEEAVKKLAPESYDSHIAALVVRSLIFTPYVFLTVPIVG
ncbi:ChaC-like protein [Sistotremastrum niveocremeum HHB9708]|uniref:glutathione-specific gamma-glutamylcyclotransferase n=1 Tax=Sistotremastrum niveocremeum HHB9708 TaxID=1314777 RepID=A0A164R435_9AGAM|nr:ChaC-like protein [Sistotremastrum niveocremeum HHB9708]